MVALDDDLLQSVTEQMRQQFPQCKFRAVGVNLGKEGYMEPIKEATRDILPQLIFNNAGYIATGLFKDGPVEKQLCNLHCNAVSAVAITHHFANRLIDAKQKGAITFTSSPAGNTSSHSSQKRSSLFRAENWINGELGVFLFSGIHVSFHLLLFVWPPFQA